jgi:hypothetical protein
MDEDTPPDIVIYDREDPSPFETMMLFFCTLGGMALLVFGNLVSGALAQTLPTFFTYTLAGGLVLGGATGLTGQLLVRTLDGALIESAGLVLVSCLFVAYGTVAVSYAGLHAFFTVLFFGAMVAASVWRIIRIRRRIRRIQRAVETGADELRSHGED